MQRLDSDLLRTFLAIAETGSVTAGAGRINRSQSATSLQIKQLEEIVGQSLFRRHGRGVAPTAAGERLLPVARRVTRSLDAALADLRGDRLTGKLRIGVPDDHGRATLTRLIADFCAQHRYVELEVRCEAGTAFDAALKGGRLDLAVFEVPEPTARDDVLREDRLQWMSRRDGDLESAEALPVALFERDCWWRDAALNGLEAVNRPYRVVFTSESVTGVRSAVRAGIAAGLLGATDAGDDLARVRGLDIDQPTFLVLRRASNAGGPVVDAMADAVRRAFR